MLIMVNEKPKQLVMVNKVPLLSIGAFCATKVENNGESAMMTIPQKSRKKNSKFTFAYMKNRGEARQQRVDKNKAEMATRLVPKCSERNPLMTQATEPEAIMINDH